MIEIFGAEGATRRQVLRAAVMHGSPARSAFAAFTSAEHERVRRENCTASRTKTGTGRGLDCGPGQTAEGNLTAQDKQGSPTVLDPRQPGRAEGPVEGPAESPAEGPGESQAEGAEEGPAQGPADGATPRGASGASYREVSSSQSSLTASWCAYVLASAALVEAGESLPGMSDFQVVEEVGRSRVQETRWFAHRLRSVVDLYGRPLMSAVVTDPATRPGDRRVTVPRRLLVVAEIAAKLQLGYPAAESLLDLGLSLTSRLPGTFALLADGRIDEARARVVNDLVSPAADWARDQARSAGMSPEQAEQAGRDLAAAIEGRVLGRAPDQRADLLRASVRRAVAGCAPRYTQARRQERLATRDVFESHHGQPEGMTFLGARLPAIEGKACMAQVDAHARALRAQGDPRALAHLRADVLVHLILDTPLRAATSATGRAAGSAAPASKAQLGRDVARGVVAHVQVTVSLDTLLGLSEEPGHLTGHGSVTAAAARDAAFALGGVWRRLVTDPISGTVLDYGRTRHDPPTPLHNLITGRQVTCTHPGCDRPAERCEMDHRIRYPFGTTSDCNLDPRCTLHHRLRHETGWDAHLSCDPADPAGTVVTTSPAGQRYKTFRPTVGPIHDDLRQAETAQPPSGRVPAEAPPGSADDDDGIPF